MENEAKHVKKEGKSFNLFHTSTTNATYRAQYDPFEFNEHILPPRAYQGKVGFASKRFKEALRKIREEEALFLKDKPQKGEDKFKTRFVRD
jgi:hypothetical protein